jgi:erythromycin esterase-like protein
MADTLERLMAFHGRGAKAVVWEHNTHIGDARATSMRAEGMVNVGELVTRKHQKAGVVKVGFGSWIGTVIAGHGWGDTMRRMDMPAAMEGSWEDLLHRSGIGNRLLLLDRWKEDPAFNEPIGHRAIGVVYRPEYERPGNYVPSVMPQRYEAFIFLDETEALHPLHIRPDGRQMPETYPWGV